MTGENPTPRGYSFVLSSLDPARRSTVQRLQAPDPQTAINDLSGRGHTDIKLLADDPSRTTLSSPALRAHVNRVLSTQDQVRFATGAASPFWRIAKVYQLAAMPLLVAIGALVYRHLTPAPWTVADALLIFVLFLPLTLAATKRGGVNIHQRVQQAYLDADYDKVLSLLPALAEAMAPMGKTAVDLQITTERAKALAGLGRPDEALQTMQQLEHPHTKSSAIRRMYGCAIGRS